MSETSGKSMSPTAAARWRFAEVFPKNAGPVLAMIAVVLLFAALDAVWGKGNYLSLYNIRNITQESALVAVPAIGMTAIIIAGGIDLSAGTAITLTAAAMAIVLDKQGGGLAAVLAALAVGALCGLVNGGLIVFLRVIPFVVTLGTMTIFLGLAKLSVEQFTGGSQVTPDLSEIPPWISKMFATRAPHYWVAPWIPRLNTPVWLALGLAGFMWLLLNRTVFGRHIFAVGSSEATARICGISPAKVKLIIYPLAGLYLGFGGLLQFANTRIGSPTEGAGRELPIIAAAVIGGASLSGGRGSVVGTLAGSVIICAIPSGLVQLGVPDSFQPMIIGAITIAAVTIDQLRRRREE